MRAIRFLFTLVGLGLCVPAYAADRGPLPKTEILASCERPHAGPPARRLRCGGLLVSFGITRAIYVNGDLITQTTLNVGRISELTPAQATQLSSQLAAVNMVQIGPGNSVSTDATGTGAGGGAVTGTISQNTLNNQQITNETVINAQSNALGIIRNLNTLNTLHGTLMRAITGR
jgi:hypothetical protein